MRKQHLSGLFVLCLLAFAVAASAAPAPENHPVKAAPPAAAEPAAPAVDSGGALFQGAVCPAKAWAVPLTCSTYCCAPDLGVICDQTTCLWCGLHGQNGYQTQSACLAACH